MLKKLTLPLILVVVLGGFAFFLLRDEDSVETKEIITAVKNGEFVVKVKATGELKAKRSEEIRGPQGMRSARIYNTTITDLVPEGTVVKKGDYVASLDKSELDQRVKEIQSEIDEILTQLDQAKIDTAIELRGLRDNLINLHFSMEEKKLEVEQSRYEPQMVIRQAELDLERTQRDYNQLKAKYALSQEKAQAKISEINTRLYQKQLKLDQMEGLAKEFTIRAPKDGMVIYKSDWGGKTGPGSQISAWNPTVAELPDLSDMVSKTYVNEVDISRVQKGQEVIIKVDAFPDEEYSGVVIQVANIGEQLRGYDAKVFEVVVQMNETDSILRPAMTTSNEIVTDVIPEQVFVPLEALHSDSLSYVYRKEGGRIVRQEVISGITNSDEVIIDHGLEAGDEIYLSVPSLEQEYPLVPLDPAIKEEIRKKQEAERKKREEEKRKKMMQVKNEEYKEKRPKSRSVIIFQ